MTFVVRDLDYRYGPTAAHSALRIDRLDVDDAERIAFTGGNGAGKSTLMQLLAAILPGYQSGIVFRGQTLGPEVAGRGLPGVVYFHQTPYLFRGTVDYNLRAAGAEDPEFWLSLVGLEGFGARRARELSGGEAKRVALARALAARPEVLLADEPTAGTDAASRPHIERVLSGRGPSIDGYRPPQVLFSTHDLSLAYTIADRIVALEDGRVVPPDATIVRGEVTGTDDSFTYFIDPRAPASVIRAQATRGSFSAAVIRPYDVLLSEAPIVSSARNCLPGVVAFVESEGSRVTVTLDCGFPITARMTRAEFESFGISRGRRLYATFNASSVQLY